MHIVLFVFAFLWFAFIAPFKITLAAVVSIVLITAVVHTIAGMVVGGASLYDAFKAVGLSLVFLFIGVLTVLSFTKGHIVFNLMSAGSLTMLAYLFICYIAGFKVGLQTNFASSAIVALASTAVSGVIFWAFENFLA